MMAIVMDSSADNPTRERVQRLLNQNAELENKRRKAAQARIPSDPNAWQQMRENFQAILLEDHAFAEQHDVEYALWQLHYRRIEELRVIFNAAVASAASNSSQNGKGTARGGSDRVAKIRSQFKTFLTEATGFYHDLMLKIRAKYGLPLGYLSGDSEGQILLSQDGNRSVELKKGLISCHRCFIYLGDLARYKGLYGDGDSKNLDFATALSYYIQATSLWPSSGNPHHQLAILASYSGDELLAVYRYFRSLAVESPFVTARDNLIIAFEKNRQSYSQLLGGSKPSNKSASVRPTGRGRGKGDMRLQAKDSQHEGSITKDMSCNRFEVLKSFSIRFVRLNGIIFTRTSLETFEEVFTVVRTEFLELLPSGEDEEYNFGTEASDCRLAVVRLIAILIFSIHNVNRETENQSYAEILQRSVLLENAFSATFELVGLLIERCSLLNDPSTSYLLPGILVFIEWLACHQDIAVGSAQEEKQARARLFFWKHCITFLNRIVSRGSVSIDEDEDATCFVNMTRYEGETGKRLALPEDFELRGFIPLLPAQVILDFSGKLSYGSDVDKERKARIRRILAAAKALASVVCLGDERLYFDSKLKKFAIGLEPHISDDDLLSTSETLALSGVEKVNPVLGQVNVEAVQENPELRVEAEDEDEVIVFKPFMSEKQDDRIISKQYSSEVVVNEVNEAKVNYGNATASFSTSLEGFLGQNAFGTSSRPAVPVSTNPQYVQALQPNSSVLLPEHEILENRMAHRNLFENGLSVKPEAQNYAGSLQPTAYSVPLSLPANNGGNYSVPLLQNLVPSKLDSIMSLGVDNLSMKPSSVAVSGLKKNPVSRPIRHMGPPPGFGFVPSKTVDESVSALSLKAENTVTSQMDDYRWLDDYTLPAVNRNVGFNIPASGHAYHTTGKSTSSIGTVDFPFPGKQVMTSQPATANVNGWPEHQLSEQLKLYQEQQQQIYNRNQQSAALKQQYEAALKQQYEGQSHRDGFL